MATIRNRTEPRFKVGDQVAHPHYQGTREVLAVTWRERSPLNIPGDFDQWRVSVSGVTAPEVSFYGFKPLP